MGNANHHVFISYSHKDTAYARKLAAELKNHSIEVWMDDRIDYGTHWPRVIQENLEASAAVIVIMSANAYNSDWVQSEVAHAQAKKKRFFPVLFEGESWLSMASTQYVDVRNQSMPPQSYFEGIAKFVGVTKEPPPALQPAPKVQPTVSKTQIAEHIRSVLLIMTTGNVSRSLKLGLFTVVYTVRDPAIDGPYSLKCEFQNLALLKHYDPTAYAKYKDEQSRLLQRLKRIDTPWYENLGLGLAVALSIQAVKFFSEKKEQSASQPLNLRLEIASKVKFTGQEIERFANQIIAIHEAHNIPLALLQVKLS